MGRRSQVAVAGWLLALAVGLMAMALVLANNQPSPLALRLTWFVATLPLSVGLMASLRDLMSRGLRRPTHLSVLLRLMPLPAVLFAVQLVIFRLEDPQLQAGPPGLGSPASEATALVLYMSLWWLFVLFASGMALDMFRPSDERP